MRLSPRAALLAIVLALVGAPTSAQVESPAAGEPAASQPAASQPAASQPAASPPAACDALVLEDVASAPVASEPVDGPHAPVTGRWSRMARAPFGSEYEPAAWTGRHLVVFDHDTGRTALYSPARNRWREVTRAPRTFDHSARWTWTGRELIVLQTERGERRITGAAYDPRQDRWRRIAPLRAIGDGESDYGLADVIATGPHVIVADHLGLLAAYHPAADCWVELGEVPAEPWVSRLYVAGPKILVESRRWDEPVEMRALDPATMTWSGPVAGPLDAEAGEDGGTWVDGRLVYLTWYERGDDEMAGSDALFDPASMTWLALEHDCHASVSGSVAVDDLLVATDGRRAIDPRTLDCLDLPRPPRRLNGTERFVWTGSELLAWSGIRSLPEPPRRGGLRFTPADPANG